MSNNHNVYAKLNAARADFHNHKLTKTGRNDFAHYSYFELSDFLPHALTAFADHGLCGVVSFGIETAELHVVDIETGADIVITSPMSTANLKGCHPVQNLGASETYLRRYLWSAALELVESDPLDATTGKDKEDAPAEPGPIKNAVKAPAPKTTGAEDEEIWDVVIAGNTPMKGVGKNRKPYARWELAFEDGRKISTFDKAIGESLDEGQRVRLIVKKDGRFHKLVGIEEAHEEMVRKQPANPEVWDTDILNVELSKNKKFYQVFINDIEHPWVGTADKELSIRAAQWIEGGGVGITVKPGKGDIWELVDLPEHEPSLEEEFLEKEGE